MKFKVGDRVKIDIPDINGNESFGTIVKNPLGLGYLVKCDELISQQYCYTSDKEVLFLEEWLSKE